MTTDMIERVARAIARPEDWDELKPHWHEVFREQARAAIEAMREPTKRMVDAGRDEDTLTGAIASVWAVMIDAALKGQNPP